MEWLFYVVATLFTLLSGLCTFAVLLGLPGTWITILLAVLIEWADRFYLPADDRQSFSWWLLITCLLLATIGEILEFMAGALGAKKGGSSKAGIWGAVIGGLIGGILGMAIPVPIIGALIGAIIGTFAGALAGEIHFGKRELKESLKPATGATLGRILGTISKLPIAITVWFTLSIAAFLH